jgi:serine/threonine-protein kinase
MSDTASKIRPVQAAPPSENGGQTPATGSTSAHPVVRPAGDEQTIITGRPPIASPAVSDSVHRILEGRVMPGDRLGHFELVEFVGGGGMGRVFRALDTQLGRTVALKVLAPEQATDPDSLQRFQNEAQSSARLDHDNIARVYYLDEDRGLHFIVFEFIEGVNVRVLVERKGPLSLAEAVSYTLQVAEALAHADARAVVHRDIKPSNMLITPEGRVKLIDMGLARLRHADPAVADLTASGVTLGTFDYISPEQARDPRNADVRSDIYSLGCTFFFMLAGQPPFPEGTVLQKLLQHQGDEPPDIQQVRPGLPEESSRILRKMMAKDPRHRYASPGDLVADLLLLAEQIGLRPMSPTSRIWLVPQEPAVPMIQRHLPWVAPVLVLIGMVVLLDRYWSSPVDEQLPPPSIETPVRSPKASVPVSPKTPARGDTEREPAVAKTVPKKLPAARSPQEASSPVIAQPPANMPASGIGSSPDQGTTELKTTAGLGFTASRGALSAAGPQRPSATVGEPAPVVEKATPRSGVLVVCDAPVGNEQFSTLSAACAAARGGDIVELRYNGPREERPVKISNQRLTIRAAAGYEPVVVFRPNDADPVKCPRSMLMLTGGQLTLSNLAIELNVPRGVPADNWSLFETWGGETVRLERCLLTVRNTSDQRMTYHQDVAFFRARSAPDADAIVSTAPVATPLATVELTDCVARGEADFLRVEDLQPVHLTWNNGLLLTTERLLVAEGSQVAPKLDEMLRIELEHVTADVRGGLCRLTSTSANPHQLTVQLVPTSSILKVAAGVPMIVQEGAASVESFRQRFIWNGERNFYEDVDVFWSVRSTLDTDTPPEVMNFEAWKAYWGPSREDQPSIERLLWKRTANSDQPLHAQGPGDYTLEDPTFGDTLLGPPGCEADRLPTAEVASGRSSRNAAARPFHGGVFYDERSGVRGKSELGM